MAPRNARNARDWANKVYRALEQRRKQSHTRMNMTQQLQFVLDYAK